MVSSNRACFHDSLKYKRIYKSNQHFQQFSDNINDSVKECIFMAGNVYKIISGIGMLILVYLLLANGSNTTNIISSIASNATTGIKTLQGRG